MKFKIGFIIIVLALSFLACSNNNKKATSTLEGIDKSIDFSSAVLKIERGAFHYDQFILKDTTLTFYPSSQKLDEQFNQYNVGSEQKISSETRNRLINHIINNGIFDLKDSYSCKSSCNSELIVTFNFKDQSKKITSEDYQCNCPELLKFIEKEIIRLHNKNLKRVLLPG